MEKTILIDGQKVLFKTNGAIPLRYKAQFGKDYFKEILKMAPLAEIQGKKIEPSDLELLDFDIFYNVAWIMAKTANPTIPEPLEWLGNFDEFPMADIFPELQEMMICSLQSSKKKMPTPPKKRKSAPKNI
jgi:hypothetical protein